MTNLSRSLLLLPVVAAVTAGCGGPSVSFEVPVSGEARIPGASGGVLDQVLGSFGFDNLNNIDFDSTQEFENNEVTRDHVSSAKLSSLTLTVTDPAGADFDWLDSITFTVAADDIDAVQVASKDVANGVSEFDCDLDGVELAPYVREQSFSIRTKADANNPPEDTTITIDLVFDVVADVL